MITGEAAIAAPAAVIRRRIASVDTSRARQVSLVITPPGFELLSARSRALIATQVARRRFDAGLKQDIAVNIDSETRDTRAEACCDCVRPQPQL